MRRLTPYGYGIAFALVVGAAIMVAIGQEAIGAGLGSLAATSASLLALVSGEKSRAKVNAVADSVVNGGTTVHQKLDSISAKQTDMTTVLAEASKYEQVVEPVLKALTTLLEAAQEAGHSGKV